MLDLINRYCHGYIVLPAVWALKKRNFHRINGDEFLVLEALSKSLSANKGNLAVVLRALESMGWAESDPKTAAWRIPGKNEIELLPDEIPELLDLAGNPILETRAFTARLVRWINRSIDKWGIQHPYLPDFIDGLLVIPLLLELRARYCSETKSIGLNSIDRELGEAIAQLFLQKEWSGPREDDRIPLTGPGAYLMSRIMNAGTVMSYAPMLRRMDELLFGECGPVFARSETDGHEQHIERTLNVVASGFQHEKYFKDIESIILGIFNAMPFEEQPEYVADMGCGDGSLLKKVYDIVIVKSARGKVLERFPLTMIGVDYNDKALEATRHTLKDIPHITLHGDIGDPEQLERDLQDIVSNVENILHIRSFLDHDRPYKAPADAGACKAKQAIAWPIISVDGAGELIDPATAMQSLVEHLSRWARLSTRHGMLILEVHSVSPRAAGQFMSECESLHFDAYHAFSRQHLVGADDFLIAAAEAGWVPELNQSRHYPKVLPFTRITLNLFQKKGYRIRYATAEDVQPLAALEAASLPVALRSNAAAIRRRIAEYPQGQYVCLVNDRPVAVCYTCRTHDVSAAETADLKLPAWQHEESASIVSLLYAVASEPASGGELVDFVRHISRLKNGVERVEGGERCRHYLDLIARSRTGPTSFFHSVVAAVRPFESRYPQAAGQETIDAEHEVATFAVRRLLQIIQAAGYMTSSGQRYGIAELANDLGIIEKYKKLFLALVHMLSRYGLVEISGGVVTTTALVESFALRDFERDAGRFTAYINDKYPVVSAFWELTKRCLAAYGEVLTGKTASNDVVFQDGSMELFARIFKGNPVADYYHELLAELIVRRLLIQRERGDTGEFRILEIGAGTGGATEFVLRKLEPYADHVTLYYTDISSSFTRYGRERFGERYPWVKFVKLDIGKDPASQGFELASFDVAFAFNVLHDTEIIHDTLSWINRLLKMSGMLIMNEYTRAKDMLLFSGGLLHGLWLYNDPEVRLDHSCMLSVGKWKQVCADTGYALFSAFGPSSAEDQDTFWQSIMLCEKTAEAGMRGEIAGIAPDEEAVADNFGEVLAAVGRMISRVTDRRSDAAYSVQAPIMELGLDSLELVELRSLLNREFSIELETTVFFRESTPEKLAIYICKLLNSKAPVPSAQTRSNMPNDIGQQDSGSVISDVASGLVKDLENLVLQVTEHKQGLQIAPATPIMEMGLDSLELVELRTLINRKLQLDLPATVFFQYSTLNDLARHIARQTGDRGAKVAREQVARVNASEMSRSAPVLPQEVFQSSQSADIQTNDIAIVGMAFRFPGGISTREQLWQLLAAGSSAIAELPTGRWEWPASVDIDHAKAYLKRGGFVPDIDKFDANFFRISPKEAELMDPQQRLVLELAWHALEDAGYKASALRSSDTGVYIGACHFDYSELAKHEDFQEQAYVSTGTNSSLLANRLSYFLHLQGPSMVIDTACSSALVAVHEAVKAIRKGDCSQALVGGVNLMCTPTNTLMYDRTGILSQDSRCATFDAQANGFVRGEGGAVLILKRLSQALADGDLIHGVIKGVAVNHGGQGSSLTAPNPEAQAKLIVRAMEDGKVAADTIGYIEAHGTGTALGDPVEVDGLKQAFGAGSGSSRAYCGLGSIKSNIGHLEGAAGLAGMVKVLLALQHKQLPATLHYRRLNPEIRLEQSPFYIVDKLRSWENRQDALGRRLPRRAGVSSFGFGGANGHVILEEHIDAIAPRQGGAPNSDQGPFLFVFSAKEDGSLRRYLSRFKEFIAGNANGSLADIAYSLQIAREALACRLAVVATNESQLLAALERFLAGKEDKSYIHVAEENRRDSFKEIFGGKAGRQFVRAAAEENDLSLLAKVWANGLDIDWQPLHAGKQPRRLRLPVYEFERESFWLRPQPQRSGHNGKTAPAAMAIDPVRRLLGREISNAGLENPTQRIFAGELSLDSAVFSDHRINGSPVCPGVVFLELILESLQTAWPDSAFTLRNVCWLRPLAFDRTTVAVEICLDAADDKAIECRIRRAGAHAEVYCEATGVKIREVQKIESIDIKSLTTDLEPKVDSSDAKIAFYNGFSSRGIQHGRFYQCLEGLWHSGTRILGYIDLGVRQDNAAYILHPAVLDAALQAVAGIANADSAAALLPFSIDKLEMAAVPGAQVYVYAEERATSVYDLSLTKPDGSVCITFHGLRFRPYSGASDIKDLVYQPVWIDERIDDVGYAARQVSATDGNCTVLVISHDRAYGLEQTIAAIEHRVLSAQLSATTQQVDGDTWRLNIGEQEDVKQLLQAAMPLKKIYFLAGLENSRSWPEPGRETQLTFGLLNLFKALTDVVPVAEPLDIVIATQDTQQVDKADKINSDSAGLIGLAACFGGEYRHWRTRVVDLSAKDLTNPASHPELVHTLKRSALSDRALIVCRGQSRYVRAFAPPPPLSGTHGKFRERGVYLIIGGAGGIGYALSRYLIERYRATPVWVGRRAINDDIRASQEQLAALGVKPQYVSADVTDSQDLRRALALIKSNTGAVHGVFHSAAVLADKTVAHMSADDFFAPFAVKAAGSVALGESLQNESLDFVCFFSSLRAFAGEAGQASYAAGCTFQDSYAQGLQRSVAYPVYVVNWGYWGERGIAASGGYDRKLLDQGMEPITAAQGMAALEFQLAQDIRQALVVRARPKLAEKLGIALGTKSKAQEDNTGLIDNSADHKAAVGSATGDLLKVAEAFLVRLIGNALKLPQDRIFLNKPFEEYGIDSILIIELTGELEKHFGKLSKALFFEHRNIRDLSRYFYEHHRSVLEKLEAPERKQTAALNNNNHKVFQDSASPRAFASPAAADKLPAHLKPIVAPEPKTIAARSGAIAIIGLSGRYPESPDLQAFWENLKAGRDCITEIPASRWDYRKYYDPDGFKPGKINSKWGGFLNDIDKFDPLFFSISPREAEYMDPQERLFLEIAWEALEDAGYTRARLATGSTGKYGARVGVYVGVMYEEYKFLGVEETNRGQVLSLSGHPSSIANRVSYYCGFRGPSVAVDTMCSSSLTAIHMACQSLRLGECEYAIAGGVNLNLHPDKYIYLSQGKFSSSQGRCRSFADGGDGFVPSEGVGAVLLKPLERAIADGDHIYGVIRSSAINHGGRTNGYTVPDPVAQGELIAQALESSGVSATDISYIEAHGTGTSLGDPVEIEGLMKAFGGTQKQFCAIGSVKSNIGHCESAAGIAGVTKVLLQMRHKQLVPSIHAQKLNGNIEFEQTAFRVQREISDWNPPPQNGNRGAPRIAGISSFGAGGANAHLSLAEYAPEDKVNIAPVSDDPQVYVVPLSARDETRLRKYAGRLHRHIARSAFTPTGVNGSPVETELGERIATWLSEILSVGRESLELDEPLAEYGVTPFEIERLSARVQEEFDIEVEALRFRNCATIGEIVHYLWNRHHAGPASSLVSRGPVQNPANPVNAARPGMRVRDIAYTLQVGREPLQARAVFRVRGLEELAAALSRFAAGDKEISGVVYGYVANVDEAAERMQNDPVAARAIEQAMQQADVETLSGHWVKGAGINWETLVDRIGSKPNRISLPTYPFARKRYWAPLTDSAVESVAAMIPDRPATKNLLHPLVHENISTADQQKFISHFTGEEFFFADHHINNRHILPGTAYLEMARIAEAFSSKGRTIGQIRDVVFAEPLDVVDSRVPPVTVTLDPSDDGGQVYEICSLNRNGDRIMHSSGRLTYGQREQSPAIEINSILARCHRHIKGDEVYKLFEQNSFCYGSAFRVIEEISYNEKEVLATLRLPAGSAVNDQAYVIHPSLMDGALQSLISILTIDNPSGFPLYVPFSIESVDIHQALAPRVYVYARLSRPAAGEKSRFIVFDVAMAGPEG